MNTLFLLMAEYDGQATVPLSDVAARYLGLSTREANYRANKQTLPFPTFRAGWNKSAYQVHLSDLAAYLDACRAEAVRDWESVNC
jgi:hypothetical protein